MSSVAQPPKEDFVAVGVHPWSQEVVQELRGSLGRSEDKEQIQHGTGWGRKKESILFTSEMVNRNRPEVLPFAYLHIF